MPNSAMTRVQPAPPRSSVSTRFALVRSRSGRALTSRATLVAGRARALDHAISQALRPFTLTALRVLLGLLFVWFGGLKIIGRSPVAALVSRTLPFADPHLVLLVLGTAEVTLGLLLLSGLFVRIALPALAMHLAGTFATFVVAPSLMFRDGDPLLLTANGEFVAKNLVLITGTLVLIAHTSRSNERHAKLST
jgi:putative oxidoreductase